MRSLCVSRHTCGVVARPIHHVSPKRTFSLLQTNLPIRMYFSYDLITIIQVLLELSLCLGESSDSWGTISLYP
jgi:hypothetical protein